MTKPFITIVMPAYNESKNILAGVLSPSFDYLKKQKFTWEVIFADDGSTDNTNTLFQEIAKQNKNVKVLTLTHGGKVHAVRSGVLAATGEYVLFTDLDQSTPLKEMSKFIEEHKKGTDICIGWRIEEGRKNDSFYVKLRSATFRLIVQLLALPGIHDSQCGFKSFKTPVAKRIFSNLIISVSSRATGSYKGGFDVEVLYLAQKLHYSISQIPVAWVWRYSTPLNQVKEIYKMIMDMFTIRLYDLKGKYNNI